MRIVIAGAGRGGLNLGIHLQATGHTVTVLERDPLVAQRATEEHGLVSLTGDATDATMLQQADPEHADVILAMLHRDADNLAVALLARSLGSKRVMVRMRDPHYRAVYEEVGVHQILSETEILVGALATAIEFDAVRHSMVLGSGESVAVELVIPANATVVGRTVKDVATSKDFPRSCVIAAMTPANATGGAQPPRGASVLEAKMVVLIVATREDLAQAISFFLASAS